MLQSYYRYNRIKHMDLKNEDFVNWVIGRAITSGGLECNRAYLATEMRQFILNNAKNKTIQKHVLSLKPFLKYYKSYDLKLITKTQIEDFLIDLSKSKYAALTKEDVKRAIKRFYNELDMPDLVRWIRVNRKSPGIPAERLLNRNEIDMLIDAVPTLRDKAIVAVSYDGGLRPCELLGIRLIDIDLIHNPPHLTISGKTGTRTIPLTFSARYLSDYIDATPRLDPNAQLWIKHEVSNSPGGLGYRGMVKMLQETAKKMGLTKRLYPYVFRHSRFTAYARFMNNQQLIKFFGTHQIDTYTHLIINDLDNCIKEEQEKRLKPDSVDKLDLILQRMDRIEARMKSVG